MAFGQSLKKKKRAQAQVISLSSPTNIGKEKLVGNKMSMNMAPGIEQQGEHLPFAFKMGSNGTAGAGNNVVVNPPVSITNGAQVAEFSDPNKELFVLRIGKKSEGADKKQTLELELCTPKGPELKPIPRKETRDTQYDNKDTDGAGGKKGGKKKK